jgi:hypothetical protein
VTKFGFTILITAPGGRALAQAEIEALHEAGLSDAGIDSGMGCNLADFTREAASRGDAVISAIADIRKVPGLEPVLMFEGGTLTAISRGPSRG